MPDREMPDQNAGQADWPMFLPPEMASPPPTTHPANEATRPADGPDWNAAQAGPTPAPNVRPFESATAEQTGARRDPLFQAAVSASDNPAVQRRGGRAKNARPEPQGLANGTGSPMPPPGAQPPNAAQPAPNPVNLQGQRPPTPTPSRRNASGFIVFLMVLTLVVAAFVALPRILDERPRPRPTPSPTPTGGKLQPHGSPGDYLLPDYAAGATLRESEKVTAFSPSQKIYVAQLDYNQSAGFDLLTGEELWRSRARSCASGNADVLVCEISEGGGSIIYTADFRTGEAIDDLISDRGASLKNVVGKVDDQLIIQLRKKGDPVMVSFTGSNLNWETSLPEDYWRCHLLVEHIGCSESNKHAVLSVKEGGKLRNFREKDYVNWHSDGYQIEDSVFDFTGKRVAKQDRRLKAVPGPAEGVSYPVADLERWHAVVVDADGDIVVKEEKYKEYFANGTPVSDYTRWNGVSADGKVIAGERDRGLHLHDPQGGEIDLLAGVRHAELLGGLLHVRLDSQHYVLVPKQGE